MDLQIQGIANRLIEREIQISGSKSESNRLLILQQLFPNIRIENLSDSDDTHHLQEAFAAESSHVDIGHAGTAMRFLTAFFAAQKGKTVVLSGSDRMHNRPIKILVEALQELGAVVEYLSMEGYPPLRIQGSELQKESVSIDGNVSSQYISALLLIAPSLPNGLTLHLEGKITSVPYIKMTLGLLAQLGIDSSFQGHTIRVNPVTALESQTVVVESDWSSASYFYSIVALASLGTRIKLSAYRASSLQGDAVLAELYTAFGVTTSFEGQSIVLTKSSEPTVDAVNFDLNNAPDIAQTIAVTCFGLQMSCQLTGLHTLKIKETDRLEALREELTKLGASIVVTQDSLHLEKRTDFHTNVAIETYNDHRMAMAFAPLGMLVPISILDADVVTKSYRNFWSDMKLLGFQLQAK